MSSGVQDTGQSLQWKCLLVELPVSGEQHTFRNLLLWHSMLWFSNLELDSKKCGEFVVVLLYYRLGFEFLIESLTSSTKIFFCWAFVFYIYCVL